MLTNTNAAIKLKDLQYRAENGKLLVATGASTYGRQGQNDAVSKIVLESSKIAGNLTADRLSTLDTSIINNSSLDESLNHENTARSVHLNLDQSSRFVMTEDTWVDALTGIQPTGNSFPNIIGNGYTLYYDPFKALYWEETVIALQAEEASHQGTESSYEILSFGTESV